MKNQKGITLVALVVTIIVLLILAGVTIAMLTGENGIITNTQKADAANEEGEAIERMGLAYSTAKTEAMVQMALTRGYQPNSDTNSVALAKLVAKELTGAETYSSDEYDPDTEEAAFGYKVYLTDGDDGAKLITITYASAKFDLASSEAAGKDNLYPNIVSVMTLTTNSVQNTTQPVRKVK